MIPHSTAERLLQKHGNTAAGRRAAREALAAEITARGNEDIQHGIATAARSGSCVLGRHSSCASSRTGTYRAAACLCECHDPQGPTEREP